MRWIYRLIGLIVVLIVIAVGALFLIPSDRIAAVATRQFEAATGRAMTISGPVRPTLWPRLGVRIEGVALANVAGSDAGAMLSAQSVEVGVGLSALMGGALAIETFEINSPRIVLERDANGQGNWVFGGLGGADAAPVSASDPAAPQSGGALSGVTLDRAVITDASLRYVDHAAGTDITIEGVDITLTMPQAGGPADLTLAIRRGGSEGRLNARVGSVTALLGGEVTTISATVTADGLDAGFEGRAGLEPLAAEGQVTLRGSQLAPALALAGITGTEPLPAAARPLSLSGRVTLAPEGSVHLREGVVGVGSNRISAALDLITSGERPNLSGEISADRLDLSGFLAGGESTPPSSGGGWPTERIDASALGLMDARIGLQLGPVITGFGDLDRVRGTLVIDRARAVLTLAEMRAFEGGMTGELVANNRSGLSVGGTMQMQGVSLLPLLTQAAGFERLTGTAAATLQFLGSGQSVDAIMRSLSGQGRFDFGAGEIIGFDLAGMLRNLDAGYVGEGNRTIFDSLSGSFAVQDGALSNDDLALASSLLSVLGEGVVDIGAQVLEYRVTPEALRNSETGQALRVPLLITGPWSAPRFRLDLEGMAEQRLQEERARLEAAAQAELDRREQEARAQLEERLQQELNVTVQDGQTAEDAVRGEAEGALRDGLLRLLGGGSEPAAVDPAAAAPVSE